MPSLTSIHSNPNLSSYSPIRSDDENEGDDEERQMFSNINLRDESHVYRFASASRSSHNLSHPSPSVHFISLPTSEVPLSNSIPFHLASQSSSSSSSDATTTTVDRILPSNSPPPPPLPQPLSSSRSVPKVVPSLKANARPPPRASTFQPTSKDGVFFNLTAKPDVYRNAQPAIITEESVDNSETARSRPELLPEYADVADLSPPNYSETIIMNNRVADVEFDNIQVGNFYLYFITMFVSFVFQLPGFLFSFVLARTYAGKYGALGGLGLILVTIALSPDARPHTNPHKPHDPIDPSFTMFAVAIGVMMVFYSLFSFMRVRVLAAKQIAQTAAMV